MAKTMLSLFLFIPVLFFIGSIIWIEVTHSSRWKNRNKKKQIKPRASVVDKLYTREIRLIEAHELIRYHGSWTFKTATEAIDKRTDLIRQTISYKKNWKMTCPVCGKDSWGYEYTGDTIFCQCPSSDIIKQIYKEARKGE